MPNRGERNCTSPALSNLPLSRFLGVGVLALLTVHSTPHLGDRHTRNPTGRSLLSATPSASDPGRETLSLRFSTYFGGSDVDVGTAIAIDSEGYVHVAGYTVSDDLPTRDPVMDYQSGPLAGADAFVAKFSPTGDSLIWATYLGSSMGEDMVTSLAVDDQGRTFVAGTTTGPDFPVVNPLHDFRGGDRLSADAFVARLSSDGSVFNFATFLGGTGDEVATGIALGGDGSIYLTGTTTSMDFATTAGVVQPTRSGRPEQPRMDAFLVRLTPEGDAYSINYATYLGGAWDEIPNALAVDAEGRAWLAGMTNSEDFPTHNALQEDYAGPIRDLEGDAFVAQLSEDASTLDFATYLGGRQDDQATGVVVHADGSVYLTGSTMSNEFPTVPGSYQMERLGLRERFIARLVPTPEGWRLAESTRIGTTRGNEMGMAGLIVDGAHRVWIGGATASEGFRTKDALQESFGGGETDAFLVRLDSQGTGLDNASFLGGSKADVVTDLASGGQNICVTGGTGSPDFPVSSAFQPDFDGPPTGGRDLASAFVTCFGSTVRTGVAISPDSTGLYDGADLPDTFKLYANYPNPFNPDEGGTTIRFDVREAARVEVTLFDVLGRRRATLVDRNYPPGRHQVNVEGRDLSSGTYFVVLEIVEAGSTQRHSYRFPRKMMVVR